MFNLNLPLSSTANPKILLTIIFKRKFGRSFKNLYKALYKFLKLLPNFLLKIIVNSIFGLAVDDKGRFKLNTPNPEYNLSDMAQDAAALLEVLNIKKAHIIGASMGGMITQILALDHPEKVLTITPIMTSPGVQNDSLSGQIKNHFAPLEKS